MTTPIIGFFIGAGGGIQQPTAAIKALEDNLLFKTFDANPDEEDITSLCFWSSAGQRTFYINRTRGSSGLLPAHPEAMDWIMENGLPWRSEAELTSTKNIATETLDRYCDSTGLWPHFLSMDIQGAEYEVLKGAPRALQTLLVIITEVEFRQVYLDQKLFADTATLLRTASFDFIHLYESQMWRLHPNDSIKVLTVGEALFLRRPEGLGQEQLRKLGAIARCFGFQIY